MTAATREERIDVSFIIPAKNEEANITRCLESIKRCRTEDLSVEVCLIDNGSADRTKELARDLGAHVFEQPTLTISGLRNHGAQVSRGRYLAFVDADITLADDWLVNAVREIERPGVAAVGASPEVPAGSPWVVRTWRLSIGTRPDFCERDWLASANVMIRREVFEEVGGFDESLRTCEDVDIGYRIGKRHRLIFDTRLRAVHYGEPGTLVKFFKNETWRGTYNYRGACRHGLRMGELPSLIQPILTLAGLGLLALSAFVASVVMASLAATLLLAFPIAKTVQTVLVSGAWKSIPALLVLWSTYSFARAWAALVEARDMAMSIFGRDKSSTHRTKHEP